MDHQVLPLVGGLPAAVPRLAPSAAPVVAADESVAGRPTTFAAGGTVQGAAVEEPDRVAAATPLWRKEESEEAPVAAEAAR